MIGERANFILLLLFGISDRHKDLFPRYIWQERRIHLLIIYNEAFYGKSCKELIKIYNGTLYGASFIFYIIYI